MITALIVDNDLVMRQLLRGVLERYGDIIVIGESDSGEDAIAQVKKLDPTAVIMDSNLPTRAVQSAILLSSQPVRLPRTILNRAGKSVSESLSLTLAP
jgi:chemotaxis response regulator CheB